MRLVAKELESVGLSFAFVGGCAVWVLVDRPDFTDLRPTEDVDVIIEVVTLGELYELEEAPCHRFPARYIGGCVNLPLDHQRVPSRYYAN